MGGDMVDTDIRSQAVNYVRGLFQDRINTSERNAMEKWLSGQIQREREGWKRKLYVAMNEIERNRKLILELDGKIQVINMKMEPYVYNDLLTEETPDVSTDCDDKTSNLSRLQSNVDLIVNRIINMSDEFNKCWDVLLGVEEEDMENIPLSEILKGRIDALQAARAANNTESKWKDHTDSLQGEMKHLRESMAIQQNILDEDRMLQYELLRQTRNEGQSIEVLKLLENQLQLTDASTQAKMAEPVSKGVPLATDGINRLNRGTQTLISIGVLTPKTKSSNREVIDNKYPHLILTGKSPAVSRSVENMHLTAESDTHLKEMPDTMERHKSLEIDMNTSMQSVKRKIRGQNNTIQNLRSQVVDFATSLDKAREEISHKQHGTVNWRQDMTSSRASNNIRTRSRDNHPRNNNLDDSQNRFSDSSYLGGGGFNNNKKGGLPGMSETRHSLKSVTNSNLTNLETNTAPQTTSKCLRCHKVYKIKDNHNMACKYHPKGRKKIEKYDAHGKLAKVGFVWECCSNKPDAPGCCNGEHL